MTGNPLAAAVQELVAVAVAAAVAAERQRIAATFRSAAAGRREYADGMPRGAAWEPSVELLNMQATTLESAALVTEGNLEPLYNWLPSWRWTDEMVAALNGDEASAKSEPAQECPARPAVLNAGATNGPVGSAPNPKGL